MLKTFALFLEVNINGDKSCYVPMDKEAKAVILKNTHPDYEDKTGQ